MGKDLEERGGGGGAGTDGKIFGGKIRCRAFLRFAAARIPARRGPGAAKRWSWGSALVSARGDFFSVAGSNRRQIAGRLGNQAEKPRRGDARPKAARRAHRQASTP